MRTATLIPLDRPGRLLKKTRDFLADMELFLSDTTGAVTILLDALPYADTALKLKIIPLLGYAGKDRVLWPLYHLVMGASDHDQISRSAAMQLGLAASLSDDPSRLKTELIKNLSHPKPSVRSCCALALGWEGNRPAVSALMACLKDPDSDVQASVVAALSSVGDGRVFDHLTARLETGTMDEQRNILLNLWRFTEQGPRVEDIFLKWLDCLAPDLRLDTLSAVGMVPLSTAILNAYRRLLKDEDPRIENLSATETTEYGPLKEDLRSLLADSDRRVRQAVLRLFSRR